MTASGGGPLHDQSDRRCDDLRRGHRGAHDDAGAGAHVMREWGLPGRHGQPRDRQGRARPPTVTSRAVPEGRVSASRHRAYPRGGAALSPAQARAPTAQQTGLGVTAGPQRRGDGSGVGHQHLRVRSPDRASGPGDHDFVPLDSSHGPLHRGHLRESVDGRSTPMVRVAVERGDPARTAQSPVHRDICRSRLCCEGRTGYSCWSWVGVHGEDRLACRLGSLPGEVTPRVPTLQAQHAGHPFRTAAGSSVHDDSHQRRTSESGH